MLVRCLRSEIRAIVWILIGFGFVAPSAALADKKFTRIDVSPGLAQSNATSIAQDRHGFMWFGTQDGLHRFDGYRFRLFTNDPDDPKSLSVSFVRFLYVDHLGALWVGAENGGLNRFEEATETFVRYRHNAEDRTSLSNDTVYDIKEDASGYLWVATARGLNRFDRETGAFERWNEDNDRNLALPSSSITALSLDKSDGLWVGTDKGLAHVAPDRTQVEVFARKDNGDTRSIAHNDIRTLFVDAAGNVWIGTFGNGVSVFDPGSRTFQHLRSVRNNPQSLSHRRVSRILQDQTGLIWIGTYGGGLTTFDTQSGKFEQLRHDPADTRSLSHDQIRSIYADRSGLVWIGTGSSGVNMYDRRNEQFAHYRHSKANESSLSHNGISAIHIDPSGALWVGTFGGGLNKSTAPGSFEHLRHDPDDPHSISSNRVFSVLVDSYKSLWAGTGEDGLNRYDVDHGRFERFSHDPNDPTSLAHNRVRALFEDSQNRLWVGTYGGGLDLFDRNASSFKHHQFDPNNPASLSGNGVRIIFEDRDNNLWVGTGTAGLNRFRPGSEDFVRFLHSPDDPSSLSHNKIQALHQSRDGRLWIGTPAGLNEFNSKSGVFRRFTRKNGLVSEVIYSIVEDASGALWLSTNQGISRFDLQSETFQNFDVSDGLQANEFNSGAGGIDLDGFIIFGGINGITRFRPDALIENRFDPPVLLSNFRISNQAIEVASDGERHYLSQPIHVTEALELTHKDSIVSFEFVSLDYSAPSRNKYAYRLSGFDEEWVETDADNRFATFTGLPTGEYRLQVRATNSDGKWSAYRAELGITVWPPPWQTWWAYSLYTLTALSAFGLYISGLRRRTRMLERLVGERTAELADKNAELEVKKTAAEAAADAKSTFLTTMSHEIRTPLNAVMGMLNLVSSSNLSSDQKERIDTIHDSSAALLGIVDQILQYSKLEQGYIDVEAIPFNPRRLVRGIATLMTAVANEKGLELKTEIHDSLPRVVLGDPDKIRQIITNLLSNAIKFTHQGRITLEAKCAAHQEHKNMVTICITDTGVGIPAESRERVFDAFSQADATISRRFGGTGMGLAICKELTDALGGEIRLVSDVGKGTTFRVSLPVESLRAEATVNRGKYRILLIEDIAVNRQIIGGVLESKGHDVTACASGKEALSESQRNTYDVVLLDLHMPDMHGYEVARQIRDSVAATPASVTIIALTAAHISTLR